MKSLQIEKRVALFFFRPGEPLRKAPSPVGDDFLTERRQCRGRRRIPGSIRVARTAATAALASRSSGGSGVRWVPLCRRFRHAQRPERECWLWRRSRAAAAAGVRLGIFSRRRVSDGISSEG